jgi:hypothetical protein
VFGIAALPAAFVPIRLPVMAIVPVLLVLMPLNEFPEMTFRSTVVFDTAPPPVLDMLTPVPRFPSAASPFGVTPI